MRYKMFFSLVEQVHPVKEVCAYCKNPAPYKLKTESLYVCEKDCLIKVFENRICNSGMDPAFYKWMYEQDGT